MKKMNWKRKTKMCENMQNPLKLTTPKVYDIKWNIDWYQNNEQWNLKQWNSQSKFK